MSQPPKRTARPPHVSYSLTEPVTVAQFWSKVAIPSARKAQNGCWDWQRAKDRYGYGQFKPMSYVPPLRSHRVAWEIVNGPVPKGQLILHSCDNPACCNPAHLRPGTHQDNMDDKKRARDAQTRHIVRPTQRKMTAKTPQTKPMIVPTTNAKTVIPTLPK